MLCDRLAQAIVAAKRHCEALALLYIDIDRFGTSTTRWVMQRAICCRRSRNGWWPAVQGAPSA
jgi:hypothetical protein